MVRLLFILLEIHKHLEQDFLRKMLRTQYGTVGTQKFHSILIAVSVQIFPLVLFSDSREPIFNSRNPNQLPKTP